MRTFCQQLVTSAAFQRSILVLILLAGLLVGLETHAGIVARFGDFLHVDEARQEMEDDDRERHLATTGVPSPADDVAALRRQVDALQDSITALQRRLK